MKKARRILFYLSALASAVLFFWTAVTWSNSRQAAAEDWSFGRGRVLEPESAPAGTLACDCTKDGFELTVFAVQPNEPNGFRNPSSNEYKKWATEIRRHTYAHSFIGFKAKKTALLHPPFIYPDGPIVPARFEGYRYRFVLPYWPVLLLSAILPSIALWRMLRWFRAWHAALLKSKAGLCRFCGYDLRATPERCPECGGIPRPTHLHALNSVSQV